MKNKEFFEVGIKNFKEKIIKSVSSKREKCPQIETLHIDNVGHQDVNTEEGEKITKISKKKM